VGEQPVRALAARCAQQAHLTFIWQPARLPAGLGVLTVELMAEDAAGANNRANVPLRVGPLDAQDRMFLPALNR
jgi:hypothetical protein